LKILLTLVISILIFFLGTSYSIIFASSHLSDNPGVFNPSSKQNKLFVTFENNFAPSYEITLDPNEKYILGQNHSWVRDETSRYNLVSYSIDNSDLIPISRLARGNFTLDITTNSPHSIVFVAVPQFPISVAGADVFFLTPESPTKDNWFDADSNVSIVVPKIIEVEQNKIIRLLTGWAIDKTEMKIVLDDDSEFFSTPTIQMSNLHTVDFTTKTQFKLDVLSEYGSTIGDGWYNAGSEVTVSVIPPEEGLIRHVVDGWEGPNVESNGNSAQLTIRGPTLVQAKWTTDYSLLVLAIVIPAGASLAFIVRRKKTISASVKKTQIEKKLEKKLDTNYEIELMGYVKQKTLEKLGLMRDSNLTTESRYLQIKKKL